MNEIKYYQDEMFDCKDKDDKSFLKKNEDKFLFSYSQMSLYQECPLKYKFKYIDKLPEKPKPYFSFGQSIHNALEFFHSKLPPPSYIELIDFFSKDWKEKNYAEKGYLSSDKESLDFEKGKIILKKYWQKHKDERELPFLCEYKAYVELDGIKVIIIADKIEYLGNGRIRLIDYKTGKEGKRTLDQLYMYQKVLEMDRILVEKVKDKLKEDVDKIQIEDMVYYYVENLKEVFVKRADNDQIKTFWEKALQVVDNIRNEKFDPTPGEMQCNYCDFKSSCPIFSNVSISSNKLLKTDDKKIEKKILKYIELSLKISELKEEINSIESELYEFFDGNVLNYENDKYKIKLERKERPEICDKEKMISFLKEAGLYEKTLRPTVNSILKLLEEGEVNEELRKKISKMIVKKYYIVSDILKKNG